MRSKGFKRLRVVMEFVSGFKEIGIDLPIAEGQGVRLRDSVVGIDFVKSTLPTPIVTATGLFSMTFSLAKRSQAHAGSLTNQLGLLALGGFEGVSIANQEVLAIYAATDASPGPQGLINTDEVVNGLYLTTFTWNVSNPGNLVLYMNVGIEVFDLTTAERLSIFDV